MSVRMRTVFDTPLLTPAVRAASRLMLRLLGWRVRGGTPTLPKYVMVAAPHVSNWDGFYLFLMAQVLEIKIFWLGKHTLFRAPFGPLARWLGGVPVDRRRSTDLVSQIVDRFERSDRLVLVVAPEGSRSGSRRWRTGFYWIAHQSAVPIVPSFLDYANKIGGTGPPMVTTGDRDADLERLREFYANTLGPSWDSSGVVGD